MEEWKEYIYSELAEIIGGGTPKTSNPSYWNGNIPWLSVKDFGNDDKFVYTTEKTITEDGLHNSSTKLLQQGDLIISARGTVGELAMIPFEMAFNQSCFGLRTRKIVLPDFLYYYTKTKVREMKLSAHGSVFDTITRNTFDNLRCRIPQLSTQEKIVSILSSLDDKIECNRKINKNLEQQAQALFKSWFVDFEPFHDGNFVESELGMIPKGWRVENIKNVVYILGGGTPMTSKTEYWNGNIPFFTPKDTNDSCFCITTEKSLTIEGLNACSSRLYPVNTVFITARGTVGKISLSGKPMAMNQSCYALQSKEDLSQYYIYLQILLLIERIKKKSNGAVFSAITTKDLDEKIVLPVEPVSKKFEELIQPIFETILKNLNEIEKLSQLRDTLLPKLMSGELQVKD